MKMTQMGGGVNLEWNKHKKLWNLFYLCDIGSTH